MKNEIDLKTITFSTNRDCHVYRGEPLYAQRFEFVEKFHDKMLPLQIVEFSRQNGRM